MRGRCSLWDPHLTNVPEGLKRVTPPPIHVPPESQNVNLFRNKVFASVISYRSGGEILNLGRAINLMTGVLIRRDGDPDTQGRGPGEGRGRDSRDVTTSPRPAAWGLQELEGSARTLPWSLQGVHSPADTLIPGFRPPEL